MKLIIVRHGETDWNRENRFQGQADPPLNHAGREQAYKLAARLCNVPLTAAFSSDLRRARETAQILTGNRQIPLKLDARLRERRFGLWEGLTRDEVSSRYPELFAGWKKDPVSYTPPGGESLAEVYCRVFSFLQWLQGEYADGDLLICGHGGSLRALICAALGAPVAAHRSLRVDNGSLSVLVGRDGDFRLTRLNDTAHLRD